MIDFCVLGSGIAGSTIANLLSKKYSVHVFDKAKGPGGRSSNKRFKKNLSFDHGVQYINPKSKKFIKFIQKLFKKKDGTGRVGAFEVMVCNAPIKNLIREAKIHQIPSVMQTGQREGMMTMEKSIEELIGTGVISSAEKNS